MSEDKSLRIKAMLLGDPDAYRKLMLAEIKATLHYWDAIHAPHGTSPLPPAVAAQEAGRHVNRAQLDWLVGEVERQRVMLAKPLGAIWEQAEAEARAAWFGDRPTVDRLRDLLGRLEWAAGDNGGSGVCPACLSWQVNGHDPGCEWVAVMHPERKEATPP
jgi:hypothetical protein